MTDPRQQPILISALGVTADNHVVVTNQPVAVQPLDVTVELDGIAIGSAPGFVSGDIPACTSCACHAKALSPGNAP